jgi:hypothetical protein
MYSMYAIADLDPQIYPKDCSEFIHFRFLVIGIFVLSEGSYLSLSKYVIVKNFFIIALLFDREWKLTPVIKTILSMK